ncbi:MAG: primosomal protein N' [Lachnospiraceae bacterium]|nr:primosomal protein N' [Lachnospiraceae bacterium]MDY4970669.1 primosomal protein N' [Lachnospiraceae bacterium]
MQSDRGRRKLLEAIYAQVILDITSGNLDRTFQYLIPARLREQIRPGTQVIVPLGKGNRQVKAYVLELEDRPACEPEKIKEIIDLSHDAVPVESQLIELAFWMKRRYGAAMIQCLKTVLPVARRIKAAEKKEIYRAADQAEYENFLAECRRKHQKARVRLLEAIPEEGPVPYELVGQKLHVAASVIRNLEQKGLIRVQSRTIMRNPFDREKREKQILKLNPTQQEALRQLMEELHCPGEKKPCLLYGITGSGKTLVYMELIEEIRRQGKQAIVLIPEIALTYQTVMRFYNRFGDRVSFINSRLSAGERYDQFLRAKNGELDVMIGPRSAVFTPFPNLGLIIVDEEHESAYKSETAPRYHARDVAIARAAMCGGMAVLGSATPSMESAWQAAQKQFRLVTMNKRAREEAVLPSVHVVDMRQEMMAGNKTMFSRLLYEKLKERLERKEQSMLFLNRRGYSSFVSCRSCGEAIKCPHCDVTLTLHRNNQLKCHYCGYSIPMVQSCPSCGSPYVAGFGTGTQKVEEKLRELFPEARILRMDMDTTQGKNGHENIIAAFANEEADILVGTQMIVKGHDFGKVTLVGALAADTSLYTSDFRACERTYQLLTQAAGRAGRSGLPGEMVIQTYKPENYSIQTAAAQNYGAFYQEEIRYRRMMHYPPCSCMAKIIFSSPSENNARELAAETAAALRKRLHAGAGQVLGPSAAEIGRINDIFYYNLFLRTSGRELMNRELEFINSFMEWTKCKKDVMIQFDIL